jgi:2-polyprenyl-6-methoxyphenol hydroxylase-like FAD-dependent oxidoreductase
MHVLLSMCCGRTTSSEYWPAGVGELAVTIYRGREVTGFAQDDTGVDVELSDDQSLRAEYLVGCDGGRSLVRKAAGIEFPGWDPTTSSLIAQVEMAEKPEWGIHRNALASIPSAGWSRRSATARWSTWIGDRLGSW